MNAIRIYSEEEVKTNFVRGQYAHGQLEDQQFAGYREEMNVAEDSATETFVAGKFFDRQLPLVRSPFFMYAQGNV